jgi:hypothetical protein
MDDPVELLQWARKGVAAAARGADAKKPKRKAASTGKPAAPKKPAAKPASRKKRAG